MNREGRYNRHVVPGIAAGVVIALGGTACGGESVKTSPAAESPAYPGDPNAYGSDPANWNRVIVAKTKIKGPDTEVSEVIGFEVPGSDDWHESKPFTPNSADSTDILLRIGPGPVKFRVQLQSNKDSDLMRVAPTVKFEGPEPYSQALKKHPDELRVPPGWESH